MELFSIRPISGEQGYGRVTWVAVSDYAWCNKLAIELIAMGNDDVTVAIDPLEFTRGRRSAAGKFAADRHDLRAICVGHRLLKWTRKKS